VPWQARYPPAGWLATKSMAGAGVVARDHRVKFAVCRAIKRLYRAEIRLTLPRQPEDAVRIPKTPQILKRAVRFLRLPNPHSSSPHGWSLMASTDRY
jgi:hypothetical protein